MKILLDTQCWLWWIASPERLGQNACRRIADRNNIIYLSAASSWEIAIKYSIGKLPLQEPPWQFVPKRLPIETMHALHVAELLMHHKDPFDRLIISQSIQEAIPIMTVDKQFESYDAEIIWAS
jgi:PIN domain nuclease of toxin-antitoxin system